MAKFGFKKPPPMGSRKPSEVKKEKAVAGAKVNPKGQVKVAKVR
jgi:hypothetical protein